MEDDPDTPDVPISTEVNDNVIESSNETQNLEVATENENEKSGNAAQAPIPVRKRPPDSPRGGSVSFTLRIRVQRGQNGAEDPYARFEFPIGNERVTTESVSSWKISSVIETELCRIGPKQMNPQTVDMDDKTDDTEIIDDISSDELKLENEDVNDDILKSENTNEAPKYDFLTFEQIFTLEDKNNDSSFADSFENQPFLNIFFGTSKKVIQDDTNKEEQEGDENLLEIDQVESSQDRKFAGFVQLDLSPFLAGDKEVRKLWATSEFVGDLAQNEDASTSNDYFSAAEPPIGLLNIIDVLEVSVLSDKKMLSKEVEEEVNPLSMTLRSVKGLPGTNLDLSLHELAGHKDFSRPTMYSVLDKHCRQIRASFQFFDGDLTPRVVRTLRLPQPKQVETGGNVKWFHKTVFLAGLMPASEVYQCIEANPLVVELHDRDTWPNEESIVENELRYEKLLAVNIEEDNESASDDDTTSDKDGLDTCRDVWDVQNIIIAEQENDVLRSGDFSTHGEASFRLNGLLDRVNEVKQAFQRSAGLLHPDDFEQSVNLKLVEPVVPMKRRCLPKGAAKAAEWEFSDAQLIAMRPAKYVESETRMVLDLTLCHPIFQINPNDAVPLPIFERAVFVFPYKNPELLIKVRKVHAAVNTSALPGISLRSYQLTEEEVSAANHGELDIITGFQIVDDHCRLLVVEGLSNGGMARIRDAIKREGPNTKETKIMMNSTCCFNRRMYASFDVDIKIIRLRNPLPRLIQMPELYNRNKVSSECFSGMQGLSEIRSGAVDTLKDLRDRSLFPSVNAMNEMENKYGETVTLYDMEGEVRKKKKRRPKGSLGGASTTTSTGTTSITETTDPVPEEENTVSSKKAPLDTANEDYEKYLMERSSQPRKDFLSQHLDTAKQFREIARQKKQREAEEAKNDPCEIYIYGPQKLRSLEKDKEELRQRIANDTNASYTYSRDFFGSTVAPINPDDVEQQAKANNKSRWTTKSGFVYPAPKDPIEFIKHPDAPSASRAEELRERWVEGASKGIARPTEYTIDTLMMTKSGFNTTPIKSGSMVYGLIDPNTGKQDPEYFKSVHLVSGGGEGAALAAKSKKEREEKEWQSKVVVDNIRFMPHFTKKKSNQIDKFRGLRHGEPKTKTLKTVVSKGLSDIPVYAGEPFTEALDYESKMGKDDDASKFINPEMKFITAIHADKMQPRMNTILAKRKIPPLRTWHKTGPLWQKTQAPTIPPVNLNRVRNNDEERLAKAGRDLINGAF